LGKAQVSARIGWTRVIVGVETLGKPQVAVRIAQMTELCGL
jgi:hypothetical protein